MSETLATPEQIKELFNRARRLKPEERTAFLDQACGNDAHLQSQVESLVNAYADAGSFLESPTLLPDEHTNALPEPPIEAAGTIIGRYKVLQLIGEGGFGRVFMAEQTEPVQRKVALKIIKLGMDTRQVISRFEAERQALALMDHPNIARVLDAGATAEGRPYFAMELVKGEPVTDYCDRNHLTVENRLDLFSQVCHAVQHAHQKGVIHRDLKPSNVMVSRYDDKPMVKIIDFGIAKAIGGKLTDKTLYTEMRHMIGTPAYMSPEQAGLSDLDVDTRSDIYSLGVLQYELLTGTTPFEAARLRSADFDELRRIIREEEPPRPSTRVSSLVSEPPPSASGSYESGTPATSSSSAMTITRARQTDPKSLARALTGELDWIVMKCLEKDRTRRYETANALALDVERYMSNEPVLAGPPSRFYRLRKFVRRNRAIVTAAAVVAFSLLVGMAGTTFGLLRAEQQRELAEKREKQTQQVSEFQAAMLSDIDVEAMGKGIKERFREQVRAALERQYVGEFPDRRPRTPEEIEADLAAFDQRADATQVVDVARQVLDEYVLARAADALQKEFADQPLMRAQLHSAIGMTYHELGLYRAAELHIRAALEIRRDELGSDHQDTLVSIDKMGLLLLELGKLTDAEPYFREVLERRRRMFGDGDPMTLASLTSMGNLLQRQGELAEAESYYRNALEGRRSVLGNDHPNTLATIERMGSLLRDKGKLTEAEPFLREAMEGSRRRLGDDHPTTLKTFHSMGHLLAAQGKLDEAERYYREALEGERFVLGEYHPDTLASRHNLANVLQRQERLAEAESYCREALDGSRRVLGDEHPDTAAAMHSLANLLQRQRKLDEAEPYRREVLKRARRDLGDNHSNTLTAIFSMGSLLLAQGKLTEAEPYYREALEARHRVLGEDHPDTLVSIRDMGALLKAQGYLAEAESYARQAVDGSRRVLGDVHLDTLAAINDLGLVLRDQGKLTEAEPFLREALDGSRRILGDEHPHTLLSMSSMGTLLTAQGKLAKAEWYLRQALDGRRRVLGDAHPATLRSINYMGALLQAQGEPAEAEPYFREELETSRRVLPDGHTEAWRRYNAMSMLGEALVGQATEPTLATGARIETLIEAEPLLVESAGWLTRNADRIPRADRAERLGKALERIVVLYESWDAVAPDSGKAEKAAAWRTELENLPGP